MEGARISDLEEIRERLGMISHYIRLELPGSDPAKARDYLSQVVRALNENRTSEARGLIKHAFTAAIPDVEFILSNALKLRHDGEKLLRNKNFKEAISKFEDSLDRYRQALTAVEIMGDEEKANKLRNAMETTDNFRKIANFRMIYKRIKEAKDEKELYAALEELQHIEVPMEDDRFDAIVTGQRKLIAMQLQTVAGMIREAHSLYQKEDLYSAKKTLEAAKASLDRLMETAKKYGLVNEIGQIGELLKAVTHNISGISELLFTGEKVRGWHFRVPKEEDFTIQEEEEEEEFFDMSLDFQKRFEMIRERYRVKEPIGEGAFSYVYKAVNSRGQKVALKVLKYLDRDYMESFKREFEVAAKLEHENIVKVYRADPQLGFMEMELATGNFEDYKKPLPVELAGRIIYEVSRALHHAHSKGIYHRDVKPSNILYFGSPERAKLGDWGLAKLASRATRKSSQVKHKTILYASPEQTSRRFGKLDHRSDIFQLGVVFYEFLTGKHPFIGETDGEIINNILNENPEPPSSLNPDARPFDAIVMKMIEKDPKNRYQTVRELQNDLREALIRMGERVRESIGTRDVVEQMTKTICLMMKAIADGSTSNWRGDLQAIIRELNSLYEQTGDRDVLGVERQLELMLEQDAKPTEESLRQILPVLNRYGYACAMG